MKKIILGMISILIIFSCDVAQDQITTDTVDVSFGVALPGSNSRNLNVLTNPTVNFTIEEGTTVYMSASNIPLTNDMGVFKLNTKLGKNSNYKFTNFTVKDGTKVIYILDSANTTNTTGFSVDANGIVDPNPAQVYLSYQLSDEYTDKTTQGTSLTLVEDFFTAENLTFKVKIPTGLTVKLNQIRNSYYGNMTWNLTDGDIFDMDAQQIGNGESTLDGNSDNNVTTREIWESYSSLPGGYYTTETRGEDKYYFEVKEGSQTYNIYFTSTTYNKKEVIFTPMGN